MDEIYSPSYIFQAIQKWLEVRAEHDPSWSPDFYKTLWVDADHSSLLKRILDGKPVLEHPPPTQMSYPWYGLIEDGYDIVNARFCFHHKEGESIFGREIWNLSQSVWFVTGSVDGGWDLKHPYGWTARLTEDEATVYHIKKGELKEPGYRITITGFEESRD